MKCKISVNIDTVDFSVIGGKGRFEIPDTSTATLISPHGELIDSYQNRINVFAGCSSHSLKVRTLNFGKKLKVEGSPFAALYGQNVYTSSDLKFGVIKALKHVCKINSLKPSKEEIQRWKTGDIYLHRVDLAVNFTFEFEGEVVDTLAQIRRQLGEQGGSLKIYGNSVYWTPRNGKEYSIGFYAKGPEMRRKRTFDDIKDKETLLKECETILRVEIRLRESALSKLGLNKVSEWNEDSAQKAFSHYMKRLRFLSATSGSFDAKECAALPNRLHPILALHKAGCNLKMIYPPRTLQRHMQDFRALGFDLRYPNQSSSTTQSLTKLLSPKRATKLPPRWMHDAGLIPPIYDKK